MRSQVARHTNAVQKDDQRARCESPNGGALTIVAAVELGLLRCLSSNVLIGLVSLCGAVVD